MSKNVKINGASYPSVPVVEIPLADGSGKASFYDTTGATATESDVMAGKKFFSGTGEKTGSLSVPVVSQDSGTKILSIS